MIQDEIKAIPVTEKRLKYFINKSFIFLNGVKQLILKLYEALSPISFYIKFLYIYKTYINIMIKHLFN